MKSAVKLMTDSYPCEDQISLVNAINSYDYKIFSTVSLHFAYSSGINVAKKYLQLNKTAAELAVKQILGL